MQFDASGQVTNWVNYGSVGGSFSSDGASSTYPGYGTVSGQVGVNFDGGDRLRASFAAPKQVTGVKSGAVPEDFSVEYWVLNPSIANEEWLLQWARRGTSPRYAAFGYGYNTAFGAVAHWDTPDMGFDSGVPVSNVWHHIVVTYDGSTEKVFVDGNQNAIEAKALNVWDGDPVTLGAAYDYPPLNYVLPYSGSVAAVRVHSRALTADQVVANYNVGMPVISGPVAILGHPKNRTAPEYGATVLSVSAIGASPIAYQWYRDDVAIDGATDSTLLVSGLQIADSGAQLHCVAANSEGGTDYTATSAKATLTVVRAADTLDHRYSFDSDANDSVGTAHGQLVNGPAITDGAVVLDGVNQYVDLPNGLVTNNNNITVEAWLIDNTAGNWARLWDFGNSSGGEDFPFGTTPAGTSYMFLTPQSSWGGSLRGAYTVTGGGAGEQILETPNTRLPAGVLKHVVWTSDEALHNGVLYVDGLPVATNLDMTLTPAMLGVTSNNWFRIYNQALPPCKVFQSSQQGPDLPLNNDPWTLVSAPKDQTNTVGTTATFSVVIASCEPITYQWYQEGIDLLDETNATLRLVDVQEFSAGVYEGVAFDALGTEIFRGSATLTINHPPVAAADVLGAERDVAVTFPAALLLGNDTDPEGDLLTVVEVSNPSTSGGSVVLAGAQITYTPPAGFTGVDSFTYTVSDGRGGTASATVDVTVVPSPAYKLGIAFSEGVPGFAFEGVPYRTYRILVSEDLATWTELTAVTATATGQVVFQDTTDPLPASRFYQAVYP